MAGQRISEETAARIRAAWPSVCAAVADGALVRTALADHGVSRDMFRAFITGEPGAREAWEAAREASADSFMDEALDLARKHTQVIQPGEPGNTTDKPLVIRIEPGHARNAIDALKWASRIRNPRLYGDKAQLDVNVRTLDLTRIIEQANARLAAAPRPRILEHEQAPMALLTQRALADLL